MMFTIECVCPFCGSTTLVDVPEKGYLEYLGGALIQDAFPTLSAEKRELVKTGMCLDCQRSIFGTDEDF